MLLLLLAGAGAQAAVIVPDIGNSLVGIAMAQGEIAHAGGVTTYQRDIPYVNSGVVRIPEVQR